MSIFKAYDIRGVYPDEINEKTAYDIGRGFASLLRQENTENETLQVVVARDMRLSGPGLKQETIRGVRDGGLDVVDIDLASTPTFYFAVAFYGYDGGIMVSASHNPGRYNGFKVVRKKSFPIGGTTGLQQIEEMVKTGNFTNHRRVGELTEREGVLEDHVAETLRFASPKNIKPFTIVADPANAMGAMYLEALFRYLPGNLIKQHFELDGNFPNHEADPLKDENVRDLRERVLATKADLGIATDGDGDRLFFMDNTGRKIPTQIIAAIMARTLLKDKPGTKIGCDIKPGRITYDTIVASGGQPVLTKTGHALIKEQARRDGLYAAAELSGHYYVDTGVGFYETPMIVIIKVLEALSASGQTLADFIKPFDRYFHSGEINAPVGNVSAVLERLEEHFKNGEINKLDGLSVNLSDFWFNVRPSNTEPLLRLNVEAVSQQVMEVRRDEILHIIKEAS